MINQVNDLNNPISMAYAKFFQKFSLIDEVDVSKWNTTGILAYFCKKYKEHYSINYTFKLNGIPSKCYEIFQIRKLSMMLSSDPVILRNYIDWIFKNKVVERKRRITSIGYITTTDLVNQFKFSKTTNTLSNPINRTTSLPPDILAQLITIDDSVKTYGDLAFIKKIIESGNSSLKYESIFNLLKSLNFKISDLDTIT